jgi:hypothetical protein
MGVGKGIETAGQTHGVWCQILVLFHVEMTGTVFIMHPALYGIKQKHKDRS